MKAFLMGSTMNEETILKRTLILTGKLVAIFSIWVALVSVAVIFAASRMVVALSDSSAAQGALVPNDATKKDEGPASRPKSAPVTVTNKPNG
jgi:hypothetical protein